MESVVPMDALLDAAEALIDFSIKDHALLVQNQRYHKFEKLFSNVLRRSSAKIQARSAALVTPLVLSLICDTCGEVIVNAKQGWMEWVTRIGDRDMTPHEMRICHHLPHSPLRDDHLNGCYQHWNASARGMMRKDNHLDVMLADDFYHIRLLLRDDGMDPIEWLNLFERLVAVTHGWKKTEVWDGYE